VLSYIPIINSTIRLLTVKNIRGKYFMLKIYTRDIIYTIKYNKIVILNIAIIIKLLFEIWNYYFKYVRFILEIYTYLSRGRKEDWQSALLASCLPLCVHASCYARNSKTSVRDERPTGWRAARKQTSERVPSDRKCLKWASSRIEMMLTVNRSSRSK